MTNGDRSPIESGMTNEDGSPIESGMTNEDGSPIGSGMTIGGYMSKFRNRAADDIGMFQKELGDTVTFTPDGESAIEIVAILGEVEGIGDVVTDGNAIGHRRVIMIDPADVAAPKDKYDEIKVDDVIYTLENHRMEGSFWKCDFTSTQKTQFSSEKLHASGT